MFYVLSHYVILNSPQQELGGLKKNRSPIESYRASGFGFENPV